ncbi:hypothetical protein QBC34DRAFT_493807 [Podospora aff. communis PSN243]|uniref:Uncharacterized protein n=1 Tax=Podospora aff. communis PSN243 TaxID=3040156 RepID=A0AAV9GVG7_9PEZI|nr:hypothetical protein QBC34DRAFT_493807 [Podospora aff. communis PSN243]
MAPIPTLLNFAIVGTCGYSLYHSLQSIPPPPKPETKAEKAAKGSENAEDHPLETGYTIGAGVAMTLISLFAALHRLIFPPPQSVYGIVWLAALCIGEFATSSYLRSFWGDEKVVPLMDKYNEPISHGMEVMRICDDLALLWGAAAALVYFGFGQ